jgi:hypothetical protein
MHIDFALPCASLPVVVLSVHSRGLPRDPSLPDRPHWTSTFLVREGGNSRTSASVIIAKITRQDATQVRFIEGRY